MNIKIENIQGMVITINHGNCLVKIDDKTINCGLSSDLLKQSVDSQETYPVAVGDQVQVVTTGPAKGIIQQVQRRKNQFSRQSTRTGSEYKQQVIAANIDQVVAVFSVTKPQPKWRLLDRILSAAEADHIPTLICITKMDLLRDEKKLNQQMGLYRGLGYAVCLVSSQSGQGITDLQDSLSAKKSVLVGKSGVGKSSLLNALKPGLKLRTKETSRIDKGRHTTTSSTMLEMPFGGMVTDTPGFREFSPLGCAA